VAAAETDQRAVNALGVAWPAIGHRLGDRAPGARPPCNRRPRGRSQLFGCCSDPVGRRKYSLASQGARSSFVRLPMAVHNPCWSSPSPTRRQSAISAGSVTLWAPISSPQALKRRSCSDGARQSPAYRLPRAGDCLMRVLSPALTGLTGSAVVAELRRPATRSRARNDPWSCSTGSRLTRETRLRDDLRARRERLRVVP
jgi:hypothetical protein